MTNSLCLNILLFCIVITFCLSI